MTTTMMPVRQIIVEVGREAGRTEVWSARGRGDKGVSSSRSGCGAVVLGNVDSAAPRGPKFDRVRFSRCPDDVNISELASGRKRIQWSCEPRSSFRMTLLVVIGGTRVAIPVQVCRARNAVATGWLVPPAPRPIRKPTFGVAVNCAGNIYVSGVDRMQVFDGNGARLGEILTPEMEPGRLVCSRKGIFAPLSVEKCSIGCLWEGVKQRRQILVQFLT